MKMDEIIELICKQKLLTADEYSVRDQVVEGTELVAVGVRDSRELTAGKTYKAVNGMEDGIFEVRPFVTVIGDNDKKWCGHLSRFVIKAHMDELEQNNE